MINLPQWLGTTSKINPERCYLYGMNKVTRGMYGSVGRTDQICLHNAAQTCDIVTNDCWYGFLVAFLMQFISQERSEWWDQRGNTRVSLSA